MGRFVLPCCVGSLLPLRGSTCLFEPCFCDRLRRVRARVEVDRLSGGELDFSPLLCYIVDREQVRSQCEVENGRDPDLPIRTGRDMDHPLMCGRRGDGGDRVSAYYSP